MPDSDKDTQNVVESFVNDKLSQVSVSQENKLIYIIAAVAGGLVAWFVLWIVAAVVVSTGDVLKLSKGQRDVQVLFETLAWAALIVVPIIIYKIASKSGKRI